MRVTAGCLVALCVVLAGCGSSGVGLPGDGGEPAGEVDLVSVGTLQVGVASAAGFKTLTLPSTGQVGFTALYGTEILRLQEMGYGKLAFARSVFGTGTLLDIWTMNSDGSDQQQLTDLVGHELHPAWSPDGTEIAFSLQLDGGGDAEIYVMDADGTHRRRVTSNSYDDYWPTWSPDGSKIAYMSYETGDTEIWSINADGTSPDKLTNNGIGDAYPDWSPDGRRIVYSRYDGSDTEIVAMDPDGRNRETLTSNGFPDTHPAYSPDGTRIAWAFGVATLEDIYVMGSDGSGGAKLTTHVGPDWEPKWSPDSMKIAYRRDTTGDSEIMVMDADGSNKTNITMSADQEQDPGWCTVPTPVRTLIGPGGSDGGSTPPFGSSRPLAIVALRASGLVSAATVTLLGEGRGMGVAALKDISTELAGVKITAGAIKSIKEDMGRGMPAKAWSVRGTPATGAVLVFFSVETGKITTVVASADEALDVGPDMVVRGEIVEVYGADDPAANLVEGMVAEVVLDAGTGEMVSAR